MNTNSSLKRPHWGEQIELLQARLAETERELARLRARDARAAAPDHVQALRQGLARRLRALCRDWGTDSVPAGTDPDTGEVIYCQCLRPFEEIEADLVAVAWWLESPVVEIPADWLADSSDSESEPVE